MTDTIVFDPFHQAIPTDGPQLGERAGQATVANGSALYGCGFGEAAERTAWSPTRLSLIERLVAQIKAVEARARFAESQLAAHGRFCICRAADIAAEEAGVVSA